MEDNRSLARRIKPPKIEAITRHQGVVQSVNADGTANITIDGSINVKNNVLALNSVILSVGDTVELVQDGNDLFIIGKLGPAYEGPKGLLAYTTFGQVTHDAPLTSDVIEVASIIVPVESNRSIKVVADLPFRYGAGETAYMRSSIAHSDGTEYALTTTYKTMIGNERWAENLSVVVSDLPSGNHELVLRAQRSIGSQGFYTGNAGGRLFAEDIGPAL